MWDRLRTTSSPPAITAPEEAIQGRHRGGGVHKHSPVQKRIRPVRPSKAHRLDLDNDTFLEPLNALGISGNNNGPNRYAIQGGKVVPRHHNIDILLPSQNSLGSLHPDVVPPRRSSRRKQRHRQSARLQINSAWRPASSIYDNSDDEAAIRIPQYKLESSINFGGLAADQISPPSSPEVAASKERFPAGDVSPIDDEFDHVHQALLPGSRRDTENVAHQEQRTSIPKPNRHGQRAEAVAATQPHEPRMAGGRAWNEQVHTGRLVDYHDVDASRPTRRPVPPLGLNTPVGSPEDTHGNTSSPSDGQRMRLPVKAKPGPAESRPPWSGASGRSAIVEPVRDDFSVGPLTIPRRSSKRPSGKGRLSTTVSGSETSGSGSAGKAMRKLLPLATKHKARKSTSDPNQPPTEGQFRGAGESYPSPPTSEFPATGTKSRETPPPNWHNQALASHPPDRIPSSINAIKRKPPPPSAQVSQASAYLTPNTKSSDDTGNLAAPVSPSPARTDDAWVQPPSRFSITTYATSNPGTPRQSAEENIPPLPNMPLVASVMDRGRPLDSSRTGPSSSEEPIPITMSSPYSPVESSQGHHQRSVSEMKSPDRRASTLSISKPLPPAPPEMSTPNDRVSHLRAQINALTHRRINIEKSIKQMTLLMPEDNWTASQDVLRKREEEKQKVAGLKTELAEVMGEEHDLGLKLYRAYKRQDMDATYEPAEFWVRRVAG